MGIPRRNFIVTKDGDGGCWLVIENDHSSTATTYAGHSLMGRILCRCEHEKDALRIAELLDKRDEIFRVVGMVDGAKTMSAPEWPNCPPHSKVEAEPAQETPPDPAPTEP